MARTTTTNSDYGAPTVSANKTSRLLLTATHALHLISSLIVLGIAAYFIANFGHNTHILFWICVAAIDTFLYLPAVALPFLKSYKGYLAPLAWIFSYLWLTAFIFSAQDYNYNGGCAINSPALVNKCSLKKTLEAFAFIAFFTNLVGTLLETRIYDANRFNNTRHATGSDKVLAPTHETTTVHDAPATTGVHPQTSTV
ncbi:hypothetical protein HBI56_103690 [Parastagonospora nodorum]|nr:hypothetical protein HBH53_090300 [Parastagonospora nodorum]KAH3958776.1 hypothetical protein HBH51_205410 [Parastagonospora nodorum]KAH3974807.1 hypothetical protein HBH52_131460 [Parastagonospora nodorum]KAH4030271.1 hypothetical protein HBI09_127240 [Parastagonospora nodorum]KAH4105403.1 hypothetical protein HBH46_086620 [Parastagonospora nodorum]